MNKLPEPALLPPRAEKSVNKKKPMNRRFFENNHLCLPLISESEPRRPALRLRRASRLLNNNMFFSFD